MNGARPEFWQRIYALREQGLIPREWKTGDIREHLIEAFKPSTINVRPFNASVSMTGGGIGSFVKDGGAPQAWRVGRGLFRLVADPDDDAATQAAETDRGARRAEELRAAHNRPRRRAPYVTAPAPPPAATQEAQASSRYPSVPVALTDAERRAMEGLSTDRKAAAIVRRHLREEHGGRANIEVERGGADLLVEMDGRTERIEVQGTEASTIAWEQLKVSGQESHDSLVMEEAVMYRVVNVNSANPRIYMLEYGRDFTLEPEPQWAVKQAPPKDAQYPLRGEPYRYDSPYDAVAADEWESGA
ncbi:MAG: hypothetical protein OXI25_01790 [Chloroflexota bacterium]|nr:hypothetical protein [Chloroflexota bacterium]